VIRVQLLQRIEEPWSALKAAYGGLSEAEMLEPGVIGTWSVNAFNAQMTARNRDVPLAEVLRRRDDTHRRLLEFIQGAPEETFAADTRVRRRLRLDTYRHYAIHAAAIRKWRENRSPG